MEKLQSFVCGQWEAGTGEPQALVNPTTEETIAEVRSGIDMASAYVYARSVGGRAQRALTLVERGKQLSELALVISTCQPELAQLSCLNGGKTAAEVAFDIGGASFTAKNLAKLGESLGETRRITHGDVIRLHPKVEHWIGRHGYVSRRGVAVLPKAFNFPVWGPVEAMCQALLAGMPVVVKPATATALPAFRLAQRIVEANIFPDGVFTFIAGRPELLNALVEGDVVAFTGSRKTAMEMRKHEAFRSGNVRMNVEADSLNAMVLGTDVEPDSPLANLFVEMAVEGLLHMSGQKCTAPRHLLVPLRMFSWVKDKLATALSTVVIGDPADIQTKLGPLATAMQRQIVRDGVRILERHASVKIVPPVAIPKTGFFHPPVVLEFDDPLSIPRELHEEEVFGPVVSVMPYENGDDLAALVRLGGGSLVTSLFTDSEEFVAAAFDGFDSAQGRFYIASSDIIEQVRACPPGTVLPMLNHGGPGRAGDGGELGGLLGVLRYMQLVDFQGSERFWKK